MCRQASRCRSGSGALADRILGAVLAGGASSRFGSDKALALIGGRTLLDRAGSALRPFVAEVVAIGRPGGVPEVLHEV